jgi:hypothetical protein
MIEESSMRQVCNALHRAIQERDNLRRELAEARAENQQLASLLESAKCVNENECFLRSREAGEAEQRLAAARADAGRLREGIEKLSGLGSWFEFVLETKVEHRGYADPSGHPHGGGVVVIPEWEARRHLDEIRAALATPAADAGRYRPSEEWLRKAAENDDCGSTSVGGLTVEMGLYEKPAADASGEVRP